MRKIRLIGIGAGNPEHLTMQAVNALNATDVVFLVDKGEAKAGLIALREEICARYISDQDGYRVVEIADPPRDRAADAYAEAVDDWRLRRAVLFEQAIVDHLADGASGAFLVWGDPALYDSTLGVIEHVLARGVVAFDHEVIPGITSVQALAAAHRLPLNRTGESIHITTGRRLVQGMPADKVDHIDNVVVMLDAGFAAAALDDPRLSIYWGANLGTPDEVLISGRLVDVAAQIARTKGELRDQHGWVMDTYLLRRD
jgi:precorrin-6A synthase